MSSNSDWQFTINQKSSKEILEMETREALEFTMVQYYLAGEFGRKIPVDWGRYMIEQILSHTIPKEDVVEAIPDKVHVDQFALNYSYDIGYNQAIDDIKERLGL